MKVEVCRDRGDMGRRAAAYAAAEIREIVSSRGSAAVLFASADSQVDFLHALREEKVDWPKVTALHVDEYVGMEETHPASFRGFLKKHLLDHVPVAAFHGIRGEAPDAAAECARYTALLGEMQPGLAILGIGENGHLAFNDPEDCDFDDPRAVRLVKLDETCRLQQVNDRAFSRIEDVPRTALTLTVPAVVRVPRMLVVVPGVRKAPAVRAAVEGPVSTACPASILQRHERATLLLDPEAASLLAPRAGRAAG